MSARNDLGKIIWETSHTDEQSISATGANIIADAILAAGYTKPRTITTTEELDALAVDSLILDLLDDVMKRTPNGWISLENKDVDTVLLAATVLHEQQPTP